jgi:transcriptional regulator with XRE-family HTH domain
LFGAIVRAHRRRLGLTQDQLSTASGVGVRTIRAIEADHIASARQDTVRRLANAFDLAGEERDRFFRAAVGETTAGDAHLRPRPAQLPPDVAGFAGRQAQMMRLDALVADQGGGPTAPLTSTIVGAAGVGKTALALHWAHGVKERFPDGQLYVNLRRSGPADRAVTTGQALRSLLDGLGIAARQVPTGTERQVCLYRGLLAGTRVLVVLDDVGDADRLEPLLPRSPGCLVLATSRDGSPGAAEGSTAFRLGRLAPAEARAMLVHRLGRQRVAAEPDAVDEIIARCGRLPLALATVAARAACNPAFALDAVAAELRDPDGGDLIASGNHPYATRSPPIGRTRHPLVSRPPPAQDPTAPWARSVARVWHHDGPSGGRHIGRRGVR